MVNPQVDAIPNFPEECWRHGFNIDVVKEDWEEIKEVETKKWQVQILKYSREGSKIESKDIEKKESSATNIGSDIDFLVANL